MLGRRSAGPLLAVVVIAVLIASFLAVDLKLKASTIAIAKAQAQVVGVRLISNVVSDKVVSQVRYDDLVMVHKDSSGRIVLIQPNTVMLNKIMASTVLEVTQSMGGQMKDATIKVPLGQLTGSNLLSGYGPKIQVRIIPVGQVYVEVEDKFEQAGINQTRHLINFNIRAVLQVAVPLVKENVEVNTTIPLAETIVVGDVPQTYVNMTGGKELIYPYIKQ